MPLQFNLTKFAVAIKLKRQMLGFSVRELSELTGLSPGTISRMEGDEGAPDMATFARLCDWLGFEPNDFFQKREDE